MNDFIEKHCKPCEGGIPPLTIEQIKDYLKALPEWNLSQTQTQSQSLSQNQNKGQITSKIHSQNQNQSQNQENANSENLNKPHNPTSHFIYRDFEFKNYYKTIAFVNAVAWMAHQENHHPDLSVSYNRCRVQYSTHAIGGLSENDFICAAKVDALGLV